MIRHSYEILSTLVDDVHIATLCSTDIFTIINDLIKKVIAMTIRVHLNMNIFSYCISFMLSIMNIIKLHVITMVLVKGLES